MECLPLWQSLPRRTEAGGSSVLKNLCPHCPETGAHVSQWTAVCEPLPAVAQIVAAVASTADAAALAIGGASFAQC